MTDVEKTMKTEQCQQLLLNNEREAADVGRRYRTVTCRMKATQDLRIERELLLDELERLTGKREFRIDEVAAAMPWRTEEGGDDQKREPVHV
jgi:hypothetical protein